MVTIYWQCGNCLFYFKQLQSFKTCRKQKYPRELHGIHKYRNSQRKCTQTLSCSFWGEGITTNSLNLPPLQYTSEFVFVFISSHCKIYCFDASAKEIPGLKNPWWGGSWIKVFHPPLFLFSTGKTREKNQLYFPYEKGKA